MQTAVDPVVYQGPVTLRGAEGPAMPSAKMPARIAVAQVVYDSPADSAEATQPGAGARLKLVSTPASEAVPRMQKFAAGVTGVRDMFLLDPAMMDRPTFENPAEILAAARRYDADIVLAFSTSHSSEARHHLMPLSVLTLGFAPNVTADADAVGRVAILDARTGYMYRHFDVTAESWQLATSWNQDDARKQAGSEAEQKVVERILEEAKLHWPVVLAQVGGAPGRGSGAVMFVQPPVSVIAPAPQGERYTTTPR